MNLASLTVYFRRRVPRGPAEEHEFDFAWTCGETRRIIATPAARAVRCECPAEMRGCDLPMCPRGVVTSVGLLG